MPNRSAHTADRHQDDTITVHAERVDELAIPFGASAKLLLTDALIKAAASLPTERADRPSSQRRRLPASPGSFRSD